MGNLVKNTTVTFISRILYAVLQLVLRFGIALFLGAAVQGEYFTFLQIALLGGVLFSVGQGQAGIYSIGKHKDYKKEIISSTFLFNLLWLPLIGLTVIYTDSYFKIHTVFALSQHVFKTAVFGAALAAFFQIGLRLLIGVGSNLLYNLYNIISVLLNILLFVFFSYSLEDKLTAAIAAYLISIAAGSVLIYSTLLYKYGLQFKIIDRTFVKRLVYGITLSLSVIVAFVNYRIDFFMVRTFLGSYESGIYSVAIMLAEIVWFIPDAVTIAFFPDIAGRSRKDGERIAPVVSRNTTFIASVFSVFIMLFSLLFLYIAADEYSGAVYPFIILLAGTTIYSNCKVLSTVLLSRRELAIANMAAFGILIINSAANYILIPLYGLNGAAAASLIAYTCGTLFALIYLSKTTGTSLMSMVLIRKADFAFYKKLILDKLKY